MAEIFSLMDTGDYEGVLALCRNSSAPCSDPALAAIEAAALYHLGRFQEAISHLKDLEGKRGASAATVLWLARCLEQSGSEDTNRQYTRAVLLDPGNETALSFYARYRLSRGDIRGSAVLVGRLRGCPDRDLVIRTMTGLIGIGDPAGAIELYTRNSRIIGDCHEYITALSASGRFEETAMAASAAYARTGDTWYHSAAMAARIHGDPHRAVTEFSDALSRDGDVRLKEGYIRALCATGDHKAALNCYREWFSLSRERTCRCLLGMITFGSGDVQGGASILEEVLCDAISLGDPPETIYDLFSEYASLLMTYLPASAARNRIRSFALSREESIARSAAGEFFAYLGDQKEAGEFLLDAYRRDFLVGGLSYARFLINSGDTGEAEKVLLYIARNVRRMPDLQRVACAATCQEKTLNRMPRLLKYLIERLGRESSHLSYEGFEVYAILLLKQALHHEEQGELSECKRLCLIGLDVVPPHSLAVNPGDFTSLILRCKERMPADYPCFSDEQGQGPTPFSTPEPTMFDGGVLTEDEEKVLHFLREHGRAHERELRELMGSRRITGLIGQIIRKAREQGMVIVEREGMSENGEVYAYVGP
jgi:tetratricopeptide (TPR) repeat protein